MYLLTILLPVSLPAIFGLLYVVSAAFSLFSSFILSLLLRRGGTGGGAWITVSSTTPALLFRESSVLGDLISTYVSFSLSSFPSCPIVADSNDVVWGPGCMGEQAGGGGDRYGGGWREGDMTSKDSSDAEKSLKGFIEADVMEDTDSEDGLGNTGDASTLRLSCPIALRYFFFSIKYFSP